MYRLAARPHPVEFFGSCPGFAKRPDHPTCQFIRIPCAHNTDHFPTNVAADGGVTKPALVRTGQLNLCSLTKSVQVDRLRVCRGRDARQEDVEGSPAPSRISPSVQRILKPLTTCSRAREQVVEWLLPPSSPHNHRSAEPPALICATNLHRITNNLFSCEDQWRRLAEPRPLRSRFGWRGGPYTIHSRPQTLNPTTYTCSTRI